MGLEFQVPLTNSASGGSIVSLACVGRIFSKSSLRGINSRLIFSVPLKRMCVSDINAKMLLFEQLFRDENKLETGLV